jgi:hypothetical protein
LIWHVAKRSPSASLSALRLVTNRGAILEFDEAAIHRAACDDKAELAFPAMPVPAIDVRLLAHEIALGSAISNK